MPDEQTTQTTPTQSEAPVTQTGVEPGKTPSTAEPAKVEPAAQTPAPLTLEAIKLPEGVKPDDPLVKEYVDLQNDSKLTVQERTQKQLELYDRALKAASEQGSKAWDALQTQWQSEIKADPEVGGAKLAESQQNIGRFLDRFGGDPLRKAFDETGAGNNPAIFKAIAQAGALLKEGEPKSGSPSMPSRTPAEILYPNQGKT